MESSNRWGWALIFNGLAIAIMIMVVVLILCPILSAITSWGSTSIIPIIQSYVGLASAILSGLFLLLLLIFTRHPHYDYLIISTIGMIAGIMSAW